MHCRLLRDKLHGRWCRQLAQWRASRYPCKWCHAIPNRIASLLHEIHRHRALAHWIGNSHDRIRVCIESGFTLFRSNYYSRQVQSSEMGMSLNQTAFLFSFSIRSSQRFSLLIVTSTDRCVSGSSKSKSVALRRERRFVEIISSMRWYWRNRDRFASVVKIAFVWRCEWMVTFFCKGVSGGYRVCVKQVAVSSVPPLSLWLRPFISSLQWVLSEHTKRES